MNPKNLALAALVCAFMAGCGQRSGGAEGVVTVDFHSYEERQLAEMADPFYSGKRYVALHADDQELMIGEVGKIVLHGDRIYVSERAEGPRGRHILVVHDADGRALAKIGNRGRGPGEYLQISCFDVDAEGRIHIYDGNFGAKKIYIYAPDGKFIEERQLSFSADRFRCDQTGRATWEETEGLAGRRFAKTDAGMNVQNVAGEWDMSQVDNNVVLGEGCLISTPEGVFVIKSPDEHLYRLDGEKEIKMANMGYCRFENTNHDLRDCIDAIDNRVPTSERERAIARSMFEYFLGICCDLGIVEDFDLGPLDTVLDEMVGE